jgi:hypothetical protein
LDFSSRVFVLIGSKIMIFKREKEAKVSLNAAKYGGTQGR